MSLSASWVDIPVIYAGTYYPSKEKLAGKRIVVEPLSVIVADDEAAVPKRYTFELDANGELTGATLPSAANGEVGGVYYRVTEKWTGARDPFNILVRANATEVNLATEAPVVDADLDLVSVLGLPAVAAAQAAQVAAEAAAETAAADASAAVADSVAAAATSAQAADDSASAASLSASTATSAQAAAESARDAAQLSSGTYASTTAGLAATTSGKYFSVPSSDNNEYLILYLNSAGSAVESKRYPSATALTTIVNRDIAAGRTIYTGSTVYPVLADAARKVVLGYDTTSGEIVGAGLVTESKAVAVVEGVLGDENNARFTGDSGIAPILTDANRRILFGYDIDNGVLVGQGLTGSGSSSGFPVPAAVNHMLFDGQSLSVGATATTILSTTQPYENITFNGGPRAYTGSASDYSAFKPLVEDAVSPAPDGGTNRGETPCSGAANYASLLALRDNGVRPADHVILASTAGHGDYRIDQLQKGSAWYSKVTDHIAAAKALNDDYAIHASCWVQGESDAASDALTTYETYRARLEQLQVDIDTDARVISGQTHSVWMLTYQTAARLATWPDVALAQLDLAQKNQHFALATPIYHLPVTVGDGVHLTNVGYKWMGAYFGRAYKQLVHDQRKPDWLNPLAAWFSGAQQVTVRFDVPTLPLVLDTSTLAVTTDHGFAVEDGVGVLDIDTITIDGQDVILDLASAPSGDTVVRYGLDYLGTGLIIENGASGNLRDSTPDVIAIDGVDRPMYHVCPSFRLPVSTLEI